MGVFCNQARLSVVGLENQPSHKTYDLQSILSARCAGSIMTENVWEWSTNIWFNLKPMPQEGVNA